MKYFEFKNVSFKYDKKYIIKDFSFSMEKGEILLIKGPSGIGKSTILRLISGLLNLKEGNVILDGNDITNVSAEKRNVGFLFQNFALFPHMTVYENISYGLKKNDVDYWLKLINMLEFKDALPNNLSGGQKQRVALVRSLANNPKLLLLDEPFSSLDDDLKSSLRLEVKEILKSLGITTIIVSHDKNDAIICDNYIEMK